METERERTRAEELADQLERADRDLERVLDERRRLADAVAVRDAQLEELFASRSWRITAPLRAATDAVRRLKDRYRALGKRPRRPESEGDFWATDRERYA